MWGHYFHSIVANILLQQDALKVFISDIIALLFKFTACSDSFSTRIENICTSGQY